LTELCKECIDLSVLAKSAAKVGVYCIYAFSPTGATPRPLGDPQQPPKWLRRDGIPRRGFPRPQGYVRQGLRACLTTVGPPGGLHVIVYVKIGPDKAILTHIWAN